MGKFSIKGLVDLDTKGLSTGAKKAQSSMGGLGKFLGKGGPLIAAVLAAGAAIVAFATKSLGKFIEMDKKAREVFTLIPDASESMRKSLVDGAREISKEYGTNVTDSLQGMYDALSAGVPKDNVVDFLKVASEAAQGGVTSLGDAVGAITTVMNGYGMEADQARDISDILFTTVKGGVTTFTELGANVGKVTPIASALGVEFSEVGAMFADLTAKLGKGKTAEAGTQINAMLAELGKQGTKASKVFEELSGQSFTSFIQSGGQVKDALVAMETHAKDNNVQMIDMFSSIEAGKGAMALAKDGAKGLSKALEDQAVRFGNTKKASDEVGESLSNNLAQAGSRVSDIMITFGEVLDNLGKGSGGSLNIVLTALENVAGYMKKGSSDTDAYASAWGTFQKVLTVAVKIMMTAVNALRLQWNQLSLLIDVLGVVGDIWMAVFSPIIGVIENVVVAMAELAKAMADPFNPDAWNKAYNGVKKALDDSVTEFDNWGGKIDKAMQKGSQDMGKAWDNYKKVNQDALSEIADIWSESGDWEFLDPDKVAAKNLKEAREEAVKITAEQEKQKELEEKKRKLAEEAKKLLQERVEKQKQIAKAEKELLANAEKIKANSEKIKGLEKAKADLTKLRAERQKTINGLIKDEATLHNDALGILDKLAQKDNLRGRDLRRINELRDMIAKKAQLANDATEEGLKKLKAHRDALLLIKETEIERAMKVKNLTREQAEEFVKESKVIQQIDKGIAGTSKRIKEATEHQKAFNKKVPEAKVQINGVAMNAKKLAGEINKAKAQQTALVGETNKAKAEFSAMGGEASKIEEKLAHVGEEMGSLAFELKDGVKIETGDVEKLPETMEDAKTKMSEFNDLAKDNDLVKLMNAGTLDVSTSSPIPVEVKDLKMDTKAMKDLVQGNKALMKPLNQQTRLLGNINNTLKGKFVNQ